MDIEIIEEKKITHMKSFKNGILSIEELNKFVKKIAINSRASYFTDMNEYRDLLETLLEDVFVAGYYKGIRENKDERSNKTHSVNNWDREKVYPKAGTGSYQGD